MKRHYLQFVSAKVSHARQVCRDDISRALGVGMASATKILSEYREKHPGTLEYSVTEKRWLLADPNRPPMAYKEAVEYLHAVSVVFGINAKDSRSEGSGDPIIEKGHQA